MMNELLFTKLHCYDIDLATVCYQQDKARAHMAQMLNTLTAVFEHHIISHHGDIYWPAYSLNLSKHDLLLWGYLKSTVFQTHPVDLHNLNTEFMNKYEGHSISHGNYFLGQKCGKMRNRANTHTHTHLKAHGMYLKMLPSDGGICRETTSRRKVKKVSFKSCFLCFLVEDRVHTQQKVQYKLLVHTTNP